MPQFRYRALDRTHKSVEGQIEASTETSAREQLRTRGLSIISIKVQGSSWISHFFSSKRVKSKELVIFTRQLSTMINAGVPLVRSLYILQSQAESKNLKRVIGTVARDVEGGSAFGDALEKHPTVFSPIYVNMVRAGEAGGILDEILKKLALQQEKDERIKGKFKSAMTYPIILLVITVTTFMGLMVFMMPRIGKIVGDLAGDNAKLPTLTLVMLSISGFMTRFWYIIVGVTVVGGWFLLRYIKTDRGRRQKDLLLLKIPAIKNIVIKIAVARFARIFASLNGAGVAVLQTIDVTSKALGNKVIEDELAESSKSVANGIPFSETLSHSKVFPVIVSQMVAVGEETGETGEVLVKIAEFYEEEVDQAVESLSSIIEPIMIVIMGGMVGLIAAAVIGPISNLSTQI